MWLIKHYPVPLFCVEDLVSRYPKEHSQLNQLSIPEDLTNIDPIIVMRWVHYVQYKAEEAQDVDFGFLVQK